MITLLCIWYIFLITTFNQLGAPNYKTLCQIFPLKQTKWTKRATERQMLFPDLERQVGILNRELYKEIHKSFHSGTKYGKDRLRRVSRGES